MLIARKMRIDMGHCLKNHLGKCHNLHGHSYDIELGVDGDLINDNKNPALGMVLDFSDLKSIMMEEIDAKFDHGFVIQDTDARSNMMLLLKQYGEKVVIVDFAPTAENLAKHWFNLLKPRLKEKSINIKCIKVYETPLSMAIYEE